MRNSLDVHANNLSGFRMSIPGGLLVLELALDDLAAELARRLAAAPTTASVRCSGRMHRVRVTAADDLELPDHPPAGTELRDRELCLAAIAREPMRCDAVSAVWAGGTMAGLPEPLQERRRLARWAERCRELMAAMARYRSEAAVLGAEVEAYPVGGYVERLAHEVDALRWWTRRLIERVRGANW